MLRYTLTALLATILLMGCVTTVSFAPMDPKPAPAPTEHMPQPAMLIYSDTAGWRHEEGIAGGNVALIEIADSKGLGYFTTQHSEIFNTETLSRFDLVVFNSATGDSLSADNKAAFQTWLADDGAVILIHGSMDASQSDWGFYQDELVGPHFISHPMAPQFQTADIVVLNIGHPVMDDLPDRFSATDEWYSFDGIPSDQFITLAGLDETTYDPRNTVYGPEDLRMGDQPENHPIIWARCLPAGGRAVASALGHTIKSFKATEHRQLLSNAIDWTMQAGENAVGCE